jgi:hypothetical protein
VIYFGLCFPLFIYPFSCWSCSSSSSSATSPSSSSRLPHHHAFHRCSLAAARCSCVGGVCALVQPTSTCSTTSLSRVAANRVATRAIVSTHRVSWSGNHRLYLPHSVTLGSAIVCCREHSKQLAKRQYASSPSSSLSVTDDVNQQPPSISRSLSVCYDDIRAVAWCGRSVCTLQSCETLNCLHVSVAQTLVGTSFSLSRSLSLVALALWRCNCSTNQPLAMR